MQKADKRILLKIAKQLVARCSEYTPPKVKYSELNTEVARAMLAIDELIKFINK